MRCEKVWGAIPYCQACDDENGISRGDTRTDEATSKDK